MKGEARQRLIEKAQSIVSETCRRYAREPHQSVAQALLEVAIEINDRITRSLVVDKPTRCNAMLNQGAGHACSLPSGHRGPHRDRDIAQWSDEVPGSRTTSVPEGTK